jgi:RNA polymerase sigma factor (sigma-70 family)
VETEADIDLAQAYDYQLDLGRLRQALKRLPSPMAEVVQLRFIEALSVRQVANQLDLSEANVRVIQYRALQKLRQDLQ